MVKKISWILLGVLGLFLCGCETISSRIAHDQEFFQTLPANHQEKIRRGKVELGYTMREVKLALGAPSRKASRESAAGKQEVWVYTEYISDSYYRPYDYYDPYYWRRDYYDPGFGMWSPFHRPYQENPEYVTREVVFAGEKVVAITEFPSPIPYNSERY